MLTRTALGAALAGLAFVAFERPDDTIEFAPADGTTVKKTFVTSGSFALDDYSLTMNGEEFDLVHRAHDRSIYAHGAINAGRWLVKQAAGFYSARDWLADI